MSAVVALVAVVVVVIVAVISAVVVAAEADGVGVEVVAVRLRIWLEVAKVLSGNNETAVLPPRLLFLGVGGWLTITVRVVEAANPPESITE